MADDAGNTDTGRLVVCGGPLWAGPGQYWPWGEVEIQAGRVSYAGAERDEPVAAGARVLDAQGGLIMPGLINAHCHGPMVLFRGLADDLPLADWWGKVMFPAEARFVRPAMTEVCCLLAAAEMLLSGTTCVGDAYFCMEAGARAYALAGLRAVAAQGIIDFPAPGVPDPKAKFEVCREFVAACQELGPLVTPALFAHSLYTCSPQTLEGTAALAAELGVPWYTHLAETQDEVATVKKRYKATPARHLENLGLLAGLKAGAHGVWLDEDELALVAERGVSLVHCPESNLKLASGAGRPELWLKAGINAGLGTDGAASNNDLDMIGELGTAARLAKLASGDPAALRAEQALDMALAGSAKTLGLEGACGRLAPGYAGDLIVLYADRPHLTPLYDPPSALAYQARGADVRHVVVDGRLVVHERRILAFDLKAVMAKVNAVAVAVGSGLDL